MSKSELKKLAELMRMDGYSFKEIGVKLNISKSTAYLWLSKIELSKKEKNRLDNFEVSGRKKGVETNKKKKDAENDLINNRVDKYFSKNNFKEIDPKTACALLYWCEGSKNKGNSAVTFTNSDPEMIQYFLSVFRKAFQLEERKFHGTIHLHEYHDPERQLKYWSKISGIPESQFFKPYLKVNTGINKKENYQGCLNVRYYDSKIYREILSVIKYLVKKQMRG